MRCPRWRESIYALSVILLLLVFAGSRSAAEDVNSLPKPAGYLNDFAHVTDAASAAQIEQFCTSVEQQLGVQFALVTIQGTDDRPIRDYALELFRKWGVGSKKDNQGLLLLLAVRDHKSDVETGRGIEPYITDGFAGSTLRAMRPDLRNSQYGAALLTAARTMAAQIAQGKNIAFNSGALPPPPPIEDHPRRETGSVRGIPIPLIVLGIFFLFWLIGRIGRRGGPRGGPGGYGGGGGFPTGLILGSLLGGRGGFGGGGNWGGGGFGGGGSGGGGGFGGFGGGDAGGGGASSDW